MVPASRTRREYIANAGKGISRLEVAEIIDESRFLTESNTLVKLIATEFLSEMQKSGHLLLVGMPTNEEPHADQTEDQAPGAREADGASCTPVGL